MTNVQQNPNAQKPKYDLGERTACFSEKIIDFAKKIPQSTITRPLISQIIRSGTSIGANYSEADEASSKKDFINKVSIANKESKETKYWLRILSYAAQEHKEEARMLWKEAEELNLIFSAIIRKTRGKD
ncbi:MAG: four helix bundle protein [Candidatus Lloydbacteria bacterium RIFCSPHIGHO2_02_FULL_51_22]|uniref:Four helix bundle protein n=2 Tax=Candidatus Lloydiibacteriota TaxID=1817910 RepID=A0A1G2D9R0_9BACT|nr:MAG: four helix bundle protein [Candidatus Lloydbacteria bacterium RIFCSPHIGHO2_02_FULL_51_22]OGZ15034.1 MAG: four helix bundle protein [Candidatus Lloydbacteria bacterium RIFCSPLOWO2_02_FULL_51_11]